MAVSSTTGGLRTGVCLSTDRPQNPYNGQVVYETDTNRTLVWDNSAWVVVADPALVSYSGTGATVTADAMTVAGENVTPYTGRRNLLYNGAMQVAQRGTSSTGITGIGYVTADRWRLAASTIGTYTNSVENDAPTGSGFAKSFKVLCTTADASPASGDLLLIDQHLEGQDCQAIKKGTSAAEQLTLSFWVKSNVTGTYVAQLVDEDNNRVVSHAYTISSSDTWEKKVITFPADTSGALDNDNNASLRPVFWLAAGSTYTSGTLDSVWGDGSNAGNRAVGQVNLASAVNNYWQVTGVQLEVGDKATPFEHRSFGEELALCKRYFFRCVDPAGVGVTDSVSRATRVLIPFNTEMRAVPTSSVSGTFNFWNGGSTGTATALLLTVNNRFQGQLDFNGGVGSAGGTVTLYTNSGSQYIDFAAEL